MIKSIIVMVAAVMLLIESGCIKSGHNGFPVPEMRCMQVLTWEE